jgi:hypothetical protein
MKQLLFLYIWLFSPYLLANTFVKNEEDFLVHMVNHVQNVGKLTDALIDMAEKDPEVKIALGLSPDTPLNSDLKQLVRNFISIHDASKVNTSKEFLNRYSIRRPLIKDLYALYGKTLSQMSAEEKSIIDSKINGTDVKERLRFIELKKPTTQQMQFIDSVEKMADKVERGSNPVTSEEMAKNKILNSQRLEEEFASAKTQEEIEAIKRKIVLSKKLEELYPKVTTPFTEFKAKALVFKKNLQEAGLFADYLDDFSVYQIMRDYQDLNGEVVPKATDLRKFFYENSEALNKVKLMVKPSTANEGAVMLDFLKIDYAKKNGFQYESRFARLYETLAGECEK